MNLYSGSGPFQVRVARFLPPPAWPRLRTRSIMAKSKAPVPQGSSAATRWIAGCVVVAGGAVALSWSLGLFSPEPPPPEPTPAAGTPTAPVTRSQAAAPLGTAAWLLANGQRKPAPAQHADSRETPAGCGPSGEPCSDDAVCLDGGCVSTVCAADAGPGSSCALSGGRTGACCGERCADLEADAANCGRCGTGCEHGLECVAGHCLARSCTAQMAGTPCAGPGQQAEALCCRGACVERSAWATDSDNCGGCGHACASGLTCRQGECIEAATGAQPAWTCLEPGHTCPEGTFCVLDACYPRDCGADSDGLLCPTATPGLLGHCCGQRCTDVFSDPANCRACGVHCGPGKVCRAGECAP